MAPSFSLAGKIALVTGSSRGIGRAMALGLAEAGADIICTSRTLEGTRETSQTVRSIGRKAWQVAADVSDLAQVRQLYASVKRIADPVDILVNNAGTTRRGPASDFPMGEWQLVMRTNLDAVFLLSRLIGTEMIRRRSGKIINTASLLSFSGGILCPPYTASKHAIAGLTKTLANEWAPSNVQVNAIAPGYIDTDLIESLKQDPERTRQILDRIPAGRWGKPEDLAGAAVFLASSAADYVNGHVLVVDGGWMAR